MPRGTHRNPWKADDADYNHKRDKLYVPKHATKEREVEARVKRALKEEADKVDPKGGLGSIFRRTKRDK